MELVLDATIDDFLAKSRLFLEEHEPRDHMILAECLEALEGLERSATAAFLTLVRDRGVRAVGVLLPSRPLLVSCEDTEEAGLFAKHLHDANALPPSVRGPAVGAEAFAAAWTALSGKKHALAAEQRLLQISKVVPPRVSAGKLRVARDSDLPVVAQWLGNFSAEALPYENRTDKELRESARRRIATRSLFILEDEGMAVCLAGTAGPTPRGVRISTVYTPRELRGRGYARATVSSLAARLLISGKRQCFVHVDWKNSVAQHLYESLGFESVCDTRIYLFEPG